MPRFWPREGGRHHHVTYRYTLHSSPTAPRQSPQLPLPTLPLLTPAATGTGTAMPAQLLVPGTTGAAKDDGDEKGAVAKSNAFGAPARMRATLTFTPGTTRNYICALQLRA